MEEKKRGEAGYDPCVKYDYIYRCLVHNMNYVTERANFDPALDETSRGDIMDLLAMQDGG